MLYIFPVFLWLLIGLSKEENSDEIQFSFTHVFQNGYEGSLWRGGIIPYELANSVRSVPQVEHVIKHAMMAWQVKTCLRFILRTNETDYVEFQHSHDEGCQSDVGYLGGKQVINLDKCGYNQGQVLHELGHIIGFGHEQSRPDRDKYVTIFRRNIRNGYLQAFQKYDAPYFNTLSFEYDYNSIMHYKMKDFSKNGDYTILPLKKGIRSLGNTRLSVLDVKKTIMLYKCNDWATWTQWSACEKTCGDASQKRKRICSNSRGGTCNGTEVENRFCNMGNCPGWPDFPSDFDFRDARQKLSIAHLRAHRHQEDECILIHESEDLLHWTNYIFCNRGKRKIHMKWSFQGPISGMKCTHIYEPKEGHGWGNNYLCIPPDSPYNLTWLYDGRKQNMSCVQWYAKEGKDGWDDNFLCTEGYREPVDGAWSSWTLWSRCKTQCGKGKRLRERFCNNPKPKNEGRSCPGPHLDEKDCFKDHCRYNVCGGVLKGSQGTFVSPNFPHHYPNNINCTWFIKGPSLKRVILSVITIDIEDTTSCMFDFLAVRDEDYRGKELGRFCGNNIPEEMISRSNTLWISFVTDGMIGKPGFKASWILD